MNCKPGDLAVTVGMLRRENNGVIVEVESFAFSGLHGTVWNIRHRQPMFVDIGAASGRWVTDGQIHDSNLRPISGVPVHDEQLDEVPA